MFRHQRPPPPPPDSSTQDGTPACCLPENPPYLLAPIRNLPSPPRVHHRHLLHADRCAPRYVPLPQMARPPFRPYTEANQELHQDVHAPSTFEKATKLREHLDARKLEIQHRERVALPQPDPYIREREIERERLMQAQLERQHFPAPHIVMQNSRDMFGMGIRDENGVLMNGEALIRHGQREIESVYRGLEDHSPAPEIPLPAQSCRRDQASLFATRTGGWAAPARSLPPPYRMRDVSVESMLAHAPAQRDMFTAINEDGVYRYERIPHAPPRPRRDGGTGGFGF